VLRLGERERRPPRRGAGAPLPIARAPRLPGRGRGFAASWESVAGLRVVRAEAAPLGVSASSRFDSRRPGRRARLHRRGSRATAKHPPRAQRA
jgi:hypothetical protein